MALEFAHGLRTLRWKLFATYILIGILPLLFFSNTINMTIENFFLDKRQTELRSYASQVSTTVITQRYLYDETLRTNYDLDLQDRAAEAGARILVVDKRGYVSNDSNQSETGKFYLTHNVLQVLDSKTPVASISDDKNVVTITVPIIDKDDVVGVVMMLTTMDEMQVILSAMDTSLLMLTAMLSIIVIIIVFFISQLLLEPLKNVLAVVKRFTEGHLEERIEVSGYDEFADLAVAFNDMSEKLEKVDQSRNEFVSNVSHELKTPLSSIKVLSESLLLQEDVPNEMYKEFFIDITSEVDRMTSIVNELLTLVRLDQTETPLNIKQIPLQKMLEDVVKRLKPLAEQKQITLDMEMVKPVTVEGDEIRLSLAVSNLIENGIKYTPEGGKVSVTGDCDHQNSFITISDTGIGISEEEHNKVFTRFYRVDKTRDRQTGGTGLGLSITQKVVLLHNGSIKLSSKEGEGSTFTLRIPLKFNA